MTARKILSMVVVATLSATLMVGQASRAPTHTLLERSRSPQ